MPDNFISININRPWQRLNINLFAMGQKSKLNIMSNENKSIHEFDFNLICGYFSSLERQGPGSPEVTIKALSFIDNLTDKSRIADIGCGTGGQTIVLAQNAPGQITGLDLFPAFIDLFNLNVRKMNLQGRINGIVGSMDNLPFKNGELDLIWSEGAIYNIGFERGLKEWRKFLKTGGYVAVSEASWFTEERPAEIDEFWNDAYPEIDTIPNKVSVIQKAGFIPVAAFILPENCWTENFYAPQVKTQEIFLNKYPGNKTVEEFIASNRIEAQLYYKYKEYYGYVFYIGKKA
jgi:SAM-dependent methyltransferase